jgi:hypothetical protein
MLFHLLKAHFRKIYWVSEQLPLTRPASHHIIVGIRRDRISFRSYPFLCLCKWRLRFVFSHHIDRLNLLDCGLKNIIFLWALVLKTCEEILPYQRTASSSMKRLILRLLILHSFLLKLLLDEPTHILVFKFLKVVRVQLILNARNIRRHVVMQTVPL